MDRPLTGGLVIPYVNVHLADGGADFRTAHHARYEKCWTEGLCQTCGGRLAGLAVLFGGPGQLRRRHFSEPPLCAPCALYASQACPMVGGRMETYAGRDPVAVGSRGKRCAEPGCDCGGWVPSDPAVQGHPGDPAHPWYALYVRPGAYSVTAYRAVVRCSDRGCEHGRLLVNGALLADAPLKAVQVSEPGRGRIWKRLDTAALAELLGPLPDLSQHETAVLP
jgi:hypothetical protein